MADSFPNPKESGDVDQEDQLRRQTHKGKYATLLSYSGLRYLSDYPIMIKSSFYVPFQNKWSG